jgi:flavin-binding protein dodecin
MSGKVYKKIEVVGCSDDSIEKAIEIALAKASESVRNISWFEVREVRGAVREGKPSEWQVTVLAGFRVD